MSTASLAESERQELCDLMLEVGPDAPTLDEGWQVLDLAAHLVAREHDLWAAGGIVLAPLAPLMEMAMRRRRRQGLAELVEIVRRGQPAWFRFVPPGGQLFEYYVHHEDVRRPNGGAPRTDRPELDSKLARMVTASAGRMLRGVESGVALVSAGETLAEHGPEPHATVSGAPGDLLLYLAGRREAAVVEISGDPGAVAALEAATLEV